MVSILITPLWEPCGDWTCRTSQPHLSLNLGAGLSIAEAVQMSPTRRLPSPLPSGKTWTHRRPPFIAALGRIPRFGTDLRSDPALVMGSTAAEHNAQLIS